MYLLSQTVFKQSENTQDFEYLISLLSDEPTQSKHITDNYQLTYRLVKNSNNNLYIIYIDEPYQDLQTKYEMINFLYGYGNVIYFNYSTNTFKNRMVDDGMMVLLDASKRYHIEPNQIFLFGNGYGCQIACQMIYRFEQTFPLSTLPAILHFPKNFSVHQIPFLKQIEQQWYLFDTIKVNSPIVQVSSNKSFYPWCQSKHITYVMIKNENCLTNHHYIFTLSSIFDKK